MKYNSSLFFFKSALVFVAGAIPLQATSYALSNFGKTEIVGSLSTVIESGAASNFPTSNLTVGTSFAKFQMVNSATAVRAFDMKVTLTGVFGDLDNNGGQTGLMIAQTVNSQGLNDPGTMSVLTDFSSLLETSITLQFDFFAPDTETPLTVALELTSFDYDYGQFLQVNNSDFTKSAHGSLLTKTNPSIGTTRWSGPNNEINATFAQTSNAVAVNNVADSSFSLTMGKTTGGGNSLYMFEFRDPSVNLGSPLTPVDAVPEPSGALIACLGALTMLRRRRD